MRLKCWTIIKYFIIIFSPFIVGLVLISTRSKHKESLNSRRTFRQRNMPKTITEVNHRRFRILKSIDYERFANDKYISNCYQSNCVLIVGYFRGGTTMTLDVLAETDDNFYVFEPISVLTEHTNAEIPVEFVNGTSRVIDKKTDLPGLQAEMLLNWFNCDFTRLNTGDLKSTNLMHHSRETRNFYGCQHLAGIHPCIKVLKSACIPKQRRILKVVRLRMGTVENILKRSSKIKIIYLVRDPRAMIHSLVKSKLLDPQKIQEKAQELCGDMIRDLDLTRKLKTEYRSNIFVLKYEAIVASPLTVFKKVFAFANLTMTEKVQSYINRTLMGIIVPGGSPWRTKSGNALKIANTWRTLISTEELDLIDIECQEVYDAFGYAPLDGVSLQITNFSLQLEPSVKNAFDIY